METLDLANARWIDETNNKFKHQGLTVEDCIPPMYEAYAKVLHPFSIYQTRYEADHEINPTSISWQNTAEKYGMRFYAETNKISFVTHFEDIGYPTDLYFPIEGILPRQLFVELLKVLESYTPSNEFIIYQTAPYTIWKDEKVQDLVACNADEVLTYFDKFFAGYLYAADKSWIIFTDCDLYFTIIGGTKELVSALAESQLETIICSNLSRVDEKGSMR